MSSKRQLLRQCSDTRETLVLFCQEPESFVLSKEQAERPGYNMTKFCSRDYFCTLNSQYTTIHENTFELVSCFRKYVSIITHNVDKKIGLQQKLFNSTRGR